MTSVGAGSGALAYPRDWEDEDRMHFLLGAFSPTAALTVGDQKVQFWSSLVHEACRATRQPVFSGREMAERLQWRGQTPSCLQQVLVVMRKTGQLRLVRELVQEAREQGWLSWGTSVLSRPFRWVWHKYLSSHNLDIAEDVYVHVQLLKEKADLVLNKLQSTVEFRNTDQVVTGEAFQSVSLEVVEGSAVVALELELVRQGRVRCRTHDGRKVVKFGMMGDYLPVDVSDADLHIISMKETIAALQTHINKSEARHQLKLKQRQLAISCLRRSHAVQHTLASKTAMLENLQDILHQIQMAETNKLVLEAYCKGTEMLKVINDAMLPAAEEAVDQLHEVMQAGEEVGAVLAQSVESEELERELQALLSSAADEEHVLADQLSQLKLLSPPDTDPMEALGNMTDKKRPAATALH